jgi:subtilisin family serine protease
MTRPTRSLLALAVAAGLWTATLSAPAEAAAQISDDLFQRFATASVHEVIVTFSDRSQMTRLSLLTPNVVRLSQLPMAGAVLTTAQIQQVAAWPGVESIHFNAPLRYYNYEAGEITGGHAVHDRIGLKGKGVTVAVLDSGVDATHPDLKLGANVLQNVKVLGDLDTLGITQTIENLPNTDTSSGHGTHVAGTVAGSGEASKDDPRRARYYAGIAPEASLVGIGAGEAIAVLHALQGFDYALANQQRYGIDVITNSWGGGNGFDPSDPISQASYEAYRRGIVVLFAAGNDGPAEDTLSTHASDPWVIAVGSGTKSGDLSDFSSRGVAGDFYKHIDVVAPGSDINSTRALATPLPALGPLLDTTNPTYPVYYAGMSGTSMATPFVAGTVALLLEANPNLSPDQIEQILVETATPMPAYGYHVVGGGYIDVFDAVERAANTVGKRAEFLSGVTAWSSGGQWNRIGDNNALIAYSGAWQSASLPAASDGSYRQASVSKKSVPRLNFAFAGNAAQLAYPRNNKGGLADVYVDGVNRGRISYYNATTDIGRLPLTGLADGVHQVELRGIQGSVYFDGALLDGALLRTNTRMVDETETFTGTIGPSANNLEVDEFPFEVGTDVITVKATLGWLGGVDIDFSLVDPAGNEVASGASLSNPETLEFAVAVPGTYKYRVKGYAVALANYTLTSTETRAVVTN